MSSAAAAAYGLRVPGPRRSGRHLASVPPQAGPAPARGAGHPLALSDDMQARLRQAVRAVLSWPGLDKAPEKLAALVIMAKTNAETGRVAIRERELGRWIGLSQSRVASAVTPALRESGVARIETSEGEFREHTGLRFELVPLWEAHGVVGHPLALSKREFATMLHFVEALFAPGWGGRTAPGLLADCTGRAAATDRLALLLLALDTNEEGHVRLVGGGVDQQRGRPAATLARKLGCKASGAEGVLGRLAAAGVAHSVRKQTGSNLNHKSRLVIPQVAAAHKAGVAAVGVVERSTAVPRLFVADPAVAARPGQADAAVKEPQVNAVQAARNSACSDPGDPADLHADHPPVASDVVESAGDCGFSGYGRGGTCDRPECVCAREDQAAATDAIRESAAATGSSDGPLRGEKPKSSPTIPMQQECEQQTAGGNRGASGPDAAAQLLAAVGGGSGSWLRGRVPQPRRELRAALAPVQALWERLRLPSTRHLVEEQTRRELQRIATWVGDDRAEDYLAARLTRRLTAQRGRASGVSDPVGWLRARGLPRMGGCTDERCDEGALMHSGAACERCDELVSDRRGRRRRLADQVRTELPEASPEEQREAIERMLHAVVREDLAKAEERRRAAEVAELKSREEVARTRARAEAAEQVRGAQPCRHCGEPQAGGLCGVCREHVEIERLIGQAVAAVAAGCGDPDEPALTAALAADAEVAARTRIQGAFAQFDAEGCTDVVTALRGRLVAQDVLDEYRAHALGLLAWGSQACAEADDAHAAQMRRRHLRPDFETAQRAAESAAQEARQRTAEHLLATRSRTWLEAQRPAGTEAPARGRRSAYERGAAEARAVTPAKRASASWNCDGCGRLFIGEADPSALCGTCEGQATGLSRAERFVRLASRC